MIEPWPLASELVSSWPIAVELQCCPVTQEAADAAFVALDPTEQDRADRFRQAEDRNRFVVGRAALRTALGGAAGCDPASLSFAAGPHGKPLETGAARGLAFNVAHSGDYAVVAVARAQAIGVDVEAVRDGLDVLALSERVFTATERRRIERASSGERTSVFFRQWVRKEAVLKGLGVGLVTDPRMIESPPTGSDWILRDVPAPPGYVAALALLV